MNSQVHQLLLNEGHLFEGCFKSALVALRRGRSAEWGRYYAASFHFAIGLERLLKVILLLDYWMRQRRFPGTQKLRQHGGKSGHDIEKLYETVRHLFADYNVSWPAGFEADDFDESLLSYLSDFAEVSRYFNLDTLVGRTGTDDPLARWAALLQEVHERDLSEMKRIHDEDQLDAAAEMIEGSVVHLPRVSMTGKHQSFREMVQDHGMIAHALPAMCLRLLKLLIPLKELLTRIRERIHEDDHSDDTVPFMEEFLDFVCEDKTIVQESPDDWP